MMQRTSFTFKLSPDQQAALVSLLKTGNYIPREVEHTIVAAEGQDCNIALYKSGKCLIQGSGAQDWVTFVLEPNILMEARMGYEKMINPEASQPHMGIDESGKGDFFGPLVIAAAFADERLTDALQEMNVRDSKTITSDRKALEMARDIRELLGQRFAIAAPVIRAALDLMFVGVFCLALGRAGLIFASLAAFGLNLLLITYWHYFARPLSMLTVVHQWGEGA
jgi:ribonuclease HIII